MVARVLVQDTKAAKILTLISFNGKSHFSMFEVLLKALAKRGHQVTVVGFFPLKDPIPNYTDISVEGSLPEVVNNMTVDFFRGLGPFNAVMILYKLHVEMCSIVMDHPNVQKLIRSDEKFDLIITQIFSPDCFLGFSHRFNAPVISLTTSVAVPWGNDRIGNPDHPAYIPNCILPYTQYMSFSQRLVNTVLTQVLKLAQYYYSDLTIDELTRKHLGPDVPPLSELKKNTSLILVNSHFTINIPRPAVPAFVEVGGMHIKSGGKLPDDLKAYLDEAKDGVIYFSLGSMIRSETLPREKVQAFIDTFAKLPQKVLWKIDNITGLPHNVRTSKWLPQYEVLCHPNVRAFITHGGQFGTQEGVHAGVPMIGIPLGFDQVLNIMNYVTKGVAVELDYESISEETVSNALSKVLYDPSYRRNAKQLSELFRDRPQSALDTAVYWTEYVIRYRGAPHLQTAAVEMPLYQYLLLDVIAVLLLCAILFGVALYCGFKIIFKIISDTLRQMRVAKNKVNGKEE
ncbi:hypothetical protein ANN_00149 [Periplaneta americana]|uniref:UDP-glucuronosyltransferase n=1 Tax=Periplaneta americana TaxID=6978 RepID=A0ABQ8TSC3_PERAM|nr:hypothetical protein ANN_00149 [Periplaneta americana]